MRKNRQKNKNKTISKNNFDKIKDVLKPSNFDPFGSYTGLTESLQNPVQDADDL